MIGWRIGRHLNNGDDGGDIVIIFDEKRDT